jgi:hypothetical protein
VFIADGGGIFRGILESSVFIALVGKGVGKNLGELFDGAVLGVAKGGKWGSSMWMFQCLNEVLNNQFFDFSTLLLVGLFPASGGNEIAIIT